jgi:long-chain acyl-CoA synthetase
MLKIVLQIYDNDNIYFSGGKFNNSDFIKKVITLDKVNNVIHNLDIIDKDKYLHSINHFLI